jgi:hypothetical protein
LKNTLITDPITPTSFVEIYLTKLMEAQRFPLLHITTKPIVYSTPHYGGEEKLQFYMDCVPADDPFRKNLVGVEGRYGYSNDETKKKELEEEYRAARKNLYQHVQALKGEDGEYQNKCEELWNMIWANEKPREKIVEALGGRDFCKTIPVIHVPKLAEYMYFSLDDIPEGHNMAQYEDPAGRKGVLIKLKVNEKEEFDLVWIFQRYRETDCRGGLWLILGVCEAEGVDKIVDFLHAINPRPHPTFTLAK